MIGFGGLTKLIKTRDRLESGTAADGRVFQTSAVIGFALNKLKMLNNHPSNPQIGRSKSLPSANRTASPGTIIRRMQVIKKSTEKFPFLMPAH